MRTGYIAALYALWLLCSLAIPVTADAQTGAGSVTYTYDAAGRLKATQYSDGTVVNYTLDAPGNRKQVSGASPAPSAPGVPSVTNVTATSATVSWTAASGTLQSYQYSVNSGPWTSVGTALTVNLSALNSATAYTVQVHAVNNGSPGTASSVTFTTLPGAPGVPTFTSITPTTATVSWTAASGAITGYQYSVNSGAWTSVGTALTVNLSGLTAVTSYTVQVRAISAGGTGAASSASFTTPVPLPGAPGVPSFTGITETVATVSWTAASGTVTSYEYSLNSGAWINVGAALTVNLTGLTQSTGYTVQVQAVNASGNGPASSATFTTLTQPGAPGTPTFTAITTTTATVTWTRASGSVASYEYSLNSGAWVNVGTALTANLTNLTGGTSYSVQVHAVNAGGAGPASTATLLTLPNAPGVPSVSAITATTATATWTAAPGVVTSYAYSTNGGSSWTNVGTALSANLTGFTPGTNYTVQVEAVNGTGAGAASSAGFTTLPPAPGTPSVSAITATSATVTWTAATGVVTGYAYSLNAGSTWTSVGTALSANLTGLTAGTNYTVQVHAVNGTGAGSASAVGFTTLPPAPGTPSVSAITTSSATVTWTAASGVVTSYAYSINGGSSWTNVGTALSASLTGLAAGTNYTVLVEAVNATGPGAASSVGFITIPPAPGTPTVSAITPTTATVTWTAATGATSYAYSLNGGSSWTSVGASLSVNLSGLATVTTYTVLVHALNASGTGAASSASFTTLPVTDNATLSEDKYKTGLIVQDGYYKGNPFGVNGTGSISPTTLTGGVLAYSQFGDQVSSGAQLSISGFTSDPGVGWLLSATGPSATLQGSAASYSYASGVANWVWFSSYFGFTGVGRVAVQVVHH